MGLAEADRVYFGRGKVENPRFWARLGVDPCFTDKNVLDVGCGHGSLCVDMALCGAKRVLGIDLNEQLIDFARENVRENFPELQDVLEFRNCDVAKIPDDDFDIIVSKDTFEHIIGLDTSIQDMVKRLNTGGRMYIGFGPLYKSPFGDHRRTRAQIPWGHLIFPESWLIARLRRTGLTHVVRIEDLGLNKFTVADYIKVFRSSGMRIKSLNVNVSKNPLSRVFSVIRHIPFLSECFSHNLYCVLEKSDD